MRLLGWMHNKLRHASTEPFKDFMIGNYCTCLSAKSPVDDKVSHVKPRFGSIYEECENTLSEDEAKTVFENYEDETSKVVSDLFHGFLAIGTLGSKPVKSEPATPTFPMSLENIIDEKAEITENDLKLINNELENFFEADAEEGSNESLIGSSYVSTITLGSMQMEGAKGEDYEKATLCPLQGYLFGSTIELTETTAELKKEKASLGEMFYRTKITDEISAETQGKREMHTKQTHMSAKNLIKKMLRKVYGSSRNPTPSSNDAANSASNKKKLNKVLRMFHRKVHPEKSLAEKEFTRSRQEKIRKTMHYNADLVHQDEDNGKFLPRPSSMEGIQSYKNNLKLSQYGLNSSNSSGNKEHWIKTDADYVVLEL